MFEAQPASDVPYTASDEIAKMYRRPASIEATCSATAALPSAPAAPSNMLPSGIAGPTGMIANSANTGANASAGASSKRTRVRPRGWVPSLVSILSASAARYGMPPSADPNTLIRFAPIRFWIIADHLRSATVRSEPEIIITTSISVRTFAIAAPNEGGRPRYSANTYASPPAAR